VTRCLFLIVAAQLFLFGAGSSKGQTWTDAYTRGDWGGRDRTCSQGAEPDPNQCNRAYLGQVAVCWSNRQTWECNNAIAWCTYKTIGVTAPQNGSNPGNIYGCGLGSITAEYSICHGEHDKKVINFNPFKDQDEHGCDDHPGWTVFVGCAGGGANPPVSGANLCKGKPWTAKGNFPSVSGNRCGYAWFTISCWSGQ
jgi:hypothetical protein